MHVSRICSDLVKINTENPPSRTTDCIEYIRSFLDNLGVTSRVLGSPDGQDNLVTSAGQKDLLFCGHVDVVPALDAGWKTPPFSGIIDDVYVYGRGSTDMKGGCAAILAACETCVNAHNELPANLAFVCDEETGSEKGMQRLLAERVFSPCDCIIAEPTPVRHPNIGQKGLMRIGLEFTGNPGHGSLYPAVGTSAIMEAVQFLTYVRGLYDKEHPVEPGLEEIIRKSSGVLSKELALDAAETVLERLTFNPGIITGGEKSNVVAQRCSLDVEFRIPWGLDIDGLLAGIIRHAGTGRVIKQEAHDPSFTRPECRVVGRTCAAIEMIYGGAVFPIVQWAASDARHLRKHGFDVIEYGPGELPLLHAIDEKVKIESLEKASAVYLQVMQDYRKEKSR